MELIEKLKRWECERDELKVELKMDRQTGGIVEEE